MVRSSPSYSIVWGSYSTHPLQSNSSTSSSHLSCLKALALHSCAVLSYLWISVLPGQIFGWTGHRFDPLLRSWWSLGWAWYLPERTLVCLFPGSQPVSKAFCLGFCFQLGSWSCIPRCDSTSSYRRSWFSSSGWRLRCWYGRGWGLGSSWDAFVIMSAPTFYPSNFVGLSFSS